MNHIFKSHCDNIYSTKLANEVSWTQELPKTSLDFLHQANPDKQTKIIDNGGAKANC